MFHLLGNDLQDVLEALALPFAVTRWTQNMNYRTGLAKEMGPTDQSYQMHQCHNSVRRFTEIVFFSMGLARPSLYPNYSRL